MKQNHFSRADGMTAPSPELRIKGYEVRKVSDAAVVAVYGCDLLNSQCYYEILTYYKNEENNIYSEIIKGNQLQHFKMVKHMVSFEKKFL